jgi:hypothetical protein
MSDAGHRSPDELAAAVCEKHDGPSQVVRALPAERLAGSPADGGWSARTVATLLRRDPGHLEHMREASG